MKPFLLGSALVWAVFAAHDAALAEDPSVSQLAWLAGAWEQSDGRRHYEEQWMLPRGGTMLGMARTVVDDRTREFEFLQIRESDGGLVLIARPSGQAEASFTAIEITESKVVFENKDHDFPQRIAYQLSQPDSLVAWIEGERNGQPARIEFPMRRVSGVPTSASGRKEPFP
jgi:hypothetical protein